MLSRMIGGRVLMYGALAGFLAAGGCGEEPEGPTEILKKQESKTLRESGTAETKEEEQARVEKIVQKREQRKADRIVLKAFRALEKAEDDFDRAEVLSSLVALGPRAKSHIERVLPFLKAEGADLRVEAVGAVAAIMGKASEPQLRVALRDEDERVQAAAVAGWGKAGIEDMSAILPLLTDFSDHVQVAAVGVVIGHPKAADFLGALGQGLPEMGPAAAKPALAYLKENAPGEFNDDLLLEMLDHENGRIRTMTIQAIGALPKQSSAVRLKLASILGDDPSQGVLIEAHRLLKALAGAEAPEFDPFAEEAVRMEAAKAWKVWAGDQ